MDLKKLLTEGYCTIIELTFPDIQSSALDLEAEGVEGSSFSWRELETWKETLPSLGSMSLFIDDLDMFELLAPSPAIARNWIADVLDHAKNVSAMVVYGRECVDLNRNDYGRWISSMDLADETNQWQRPALDEDGEPHLSEYLAYRAEVTVKANPLTTGYSADVHGIITVASSRSIKPQQYLFKALDSGVKCSILGHGYTLG